MKSWEHEDDAAAIESKRKEFVSKVIVCRNCAEELSEGQTFCPYCGAAQNDVAEAQRPTSTAANAADTSTALQRVESEDTDRWVEEAAARRSAPPASFSTFERRDGEMRGSRLKLFLAIGIASAVLVAGLAYLVTRPRAQSTDPRLADALRPGSPEFEQYRERLVLEFDADQNAMTHERALGDVVVTMEPVVRNFTGRVVTGLELRATGLDLSNQVIKERTFVVIPDRQPPLEPNRTTTPMLRFEGVKKDNIPASLKVEITGFKLR
ncbi:MAG TPA: zinc ribbon domain-containing protein [Pyrinomonadaceae bacterium]|nr:zinc ribbon domain-containing protein [Pyrinomonadaceae bacterium]